MQLDGKKIAILIAPRGTEEPEFAKPKEAVENAGGTVTVISLEAGEAQTVNHDLDPGGSYAVDKTIDQVSCDDFDALIVPGGCVGADKLRASDDIVEFVAEFFDAEKPVAVICHAPWVLIEADVVDGRRLTSYSSIQTDLENAGADWVDEEVVVDDGLITSRNPDDLPAFCRTLVEEFANASQAVDA